jgi:hypothetical protein
LGQGKYAPGGASQGLKVETWMMKKSAVMVEVTLDPGTQGQVVL